jgi:hypothetical protein
MQWWPYHPFQIVSETRYVCTRADIVPDDNDEDGLAMVSYTGPKPPRALSAPPATPAAQQKTKKGVKRPRTPSPEQDALPQVCATMLYCEYCCLLTLLL